MVMSFMKKKASCWQVKHTRLRSTCRMAHSFRFKLDLFVLTGHKEKWPCHLPLFIAFVIIIGLVEEQTCPIRANLSSFYFPLPCLPPWLYSPHLPQATLQTLSSIQMYLECVLGMGSQFCQIFYEIIKAFIMTLINEWIRSSQNIFYLMSRC